MKKVFMKKLELESTDKISTYESLSTLMKKIAIYKLWQKDPLGSGWSTVEEHMPTERNSWGRGFDSHQVLGFFSFYPSVVWP